VLQPIPDLDHVDYLLILGANPAVSGMSFVQVPRPAETLRQIRKRGGRIVVVDPRRNETARLASEHLFIQPDTDCFFLLSLLWVLMEQGRVDREWVDRDPLGYEALREVVRQWPPERTEPITGIPRGKTEEVALCLAGPKPAACYGSVGINLGRNGTLTYWLLTVLNLLAGHFDRPGGSFFCRGAVPVDRLYALSGLDRGKKRSAAGDFQPVMGTYPAALLARGILEQGKGRIRALVVVAGNPLLSVPNEAHLKEALERLDLLVCLDLYRNETGSLAHYLLPTTDFLEREDLNFSHTGLQLRRFMAWSPAVVTPDGEQRQEWEILESISSRMGLALWGRGLGALAKAEVRARAVSRRLWGPLREAHLRARAFPLLRHLLPRVAPAPDREPSRPGSAAAGRRREPRGVPRLIFGLLFRIMGEVDFGSLQSSPRGLPLKPHQFGRFRSGSRARGRRSIRLAPEDLLREARKLEGTLALRSTERGKFLLIGKRERHTHNTWMHNADGLVKGETTNYLYLHPEDAAGKGIQEGDLVEIDGLEGDRVQVPCRFTEDLKRGVIALPHGWGHRYAAGWTRANRRPGVNVNRLASDAVWRLEPLAGVAWLTGIPVEIRKAEPGPEFRS